MRYNALPIAFAPDGALVVAVADPSDFLGISDIEVMAKTEVRLAIANPERVQELIEDLPEPPEPLPYVQADSIAALEEVQTADANGDSAGDEAEIAEREEDGEREGFNREELEQLRRQLSEATGEREREGESTARELEQLRSQLYEATDESERLRQELDQLRHQLSDVTDESDSEEIDREELKQLRRQLSDANDERERLSGEREDLRQELDQLRQQLSDATDQRDREEIDREELDQLRRQLSDANDERERLRGERERLGQELKQVRGQMNDGDGERERLHQELEPAS